MQLLESSKDHNQKVMKDVIRITEEEQRKNSQIS